MDDSPEPVATSSNPRLQALLGHEFFAPHQWKRRLVLWVGAVLVALAAILFAKASVWSYHLFLRILAFGVWIPLILTPLVFGLLAAVLFLGCLGSVELWGKREQRLAAEVLDTIVDGNWLVARIQGRPRLEKPPLPRWTAAALSVGSVLAASRKAASCRATVSICSADATLAASSTAKPSTTSRIRVSSRNCASASFPSDEPAARIVPSGPSTTALARSPVPADPVPPPPPPPPTLPPAERSVKSTTPVAAPVASDRAVGSNR